MSASSAGSGSPAVEPRHDPLLRGVRLTRSDLGGMAVLWNDDLIGWLHASIGDKWNAYVCGPGPDDPGQHIGRFTRDEAVRRIALEAGWRKAP